MQPRLTIRLAGLHTNTATGVGVDLQVPQHLSVQPLQAPGLIEAGMHQRRSAKQRARVVLGAPHLTCQSASQPGL